MAKIDALNPKHEKYIEKVRAQLKSNAFSVDDWGLETVACQIKQSDILQDFSLPALRLRSHYDLLVRHKETGFICEIDVKTTMYRVDTKRVAIEVWPILFAQQSEFPRLLVIELDDDYGIWVDQLDTTWFSPVFMPNRWDTKQRTEFSQGINQLSPEPPRYIGIPWKQKYASGDPFYTWSIQKIKDSSDNYMIALLKRATCFRTTLF